VTVILPSTLAESLACLIELQRDDARPAEALERVRGIQARYPDLRIDLLWEEESFDGSVHFDVLLRSPGKGTVSIAFAPDRALPWPMRGAQRWSEGHLMRVNGRVVRVAQAVAALDFASDPAQKGQVQVAERLINASLVREELDRDPVSLSQDAIQRAMDRFRRRRGLITSDATLRWMREHGISHDHLERLATEDAEITALRDRVAGDRVEPYFAAHRQAFDTARIARCAFPDEASARAAVARIRAGEVSLLDLARERFLADPSGSAGGFASLPRDAEPSALADAVFAALPGEIVGPVPSGDDPFVVVEVLAIEPARLDAATRLRISQRLFAAWLAERRAAATIEWFWGDADHAGTAA
jgi:putative peptide maturation system protein